MIVRVNGSHKDASEDAGALLPVKPKPTNKQKTKPKKKPQNNKKPPKKKNTR